MMNEKIKALAEQTGISFKPFIVDEEEYDFDVVYMDDSDVLEKFAELIVRECLTVCKAVGMKEVKNANESYNEGRHMGAEVCHNQIKRHFGIEE